MHVQTAALLGDTPRPLLFQGDVPGQHSIQNCHISQLTPPIEVFLNILESSRYELRTAHGLTLMTPSPRGWEAFPTCIRGLHPHQDLLGLFSISATSIGCHSGVPLVPMVFWVFLMERCATMDQIKIKFLAKNVFRIFLVFKVKVFMMPYHIALDVIATNLYVIFFIDIILIIFCGLCFQISYK